VGLPYIGVFGYDCCTAIQDRSAFVRFEERRATVYATSSSVYLNIEVCHSKIVFTDGFNREVFFTSHSHSRIVAIHTSSFYRCQSHMWEEKLFCHFPKKNLQHGYFQSRELLLLVYDVYFTTQILAYLNLKLIAVRSATGIGPTLERTRQPEPISADTAQNTCLQSRQKLSMIYNKDIVGCRIITTKCLYQ